MNNEESKQPGKISVVFGFLVFFIAFCGFVVLAYIIVKHAGLSEFATVMLSGMGGLIFFCVFFVLVIVNENSPLMGRIFPHLKWHKKNS